MGMDGIFLHTVKEELDEWIGSRIDRIYQPARDELILLLRRKGGSKRLLLSANANNARVHFTECAPENPPTPPMFCMLLRKKLGGGRFVSVRQPGCDRILYLDFEVYNELGDLVVYTIAAELMGRHSNLIVFEQGEGKIMDAIKRVDEEMSEYRPIFPGRIYQPPPLKQKYSVLELEADKVISFLKEAPSGLVEDVLLDYLQGLSPLIARELAGKPCGMDIRELSLSQWDILSQSLSDFRARLLAKDYRYTLLLDGNKPKDFSYIPILQYGSLFQQRTYLNTETMLDTFFIERDLVLRLKQQSGDLLRKLQTLTERAARTLQIRQLELSKAKRRDEYRVYGDLLQANLATLKKGQTQANVVDFYDEQQREITIPLDPSKTPIENIQRYYHEYKKAANAEEKLLNLLDQAKMELQYLESVQDLAQRADSIGELGAIRQELVDGGYLREKKNGKKKVSQTLPFLQFRSSDGFLIYCGRNNKQNDYLTLKKAAKSDLWFHTQKIHGSHVIVVTKGKEPPDRTIEEACMIAAVHSKGKNSRQVPVDYTQVRYVKKPNGAKPGMVIFTNYQTAYVHPDEKSVEQLLVDSVEKKQ